MPESVRFKVATIKSAKDGEPKVTSFTIDELARLISKPRVMLREYDAYHLHKATEKRLTLEARDARNAGDIETAKTLKAEALHYKHLQSEVKDGPAIMPYVYKNDITHTVSADGYKQRDNKRITHFSLLMLDIESHITTDEIHAVLKDFEYLLWPTISHRPLDPRYRVVLFLAEPLTPADAVYVNARIDALLPARNDLSKKTQAIDPACMDEQGRLMYLPAWLHQHPEKYHSTHNRGRLVTVNDFELSDEIQAQVQARAQLGEASKTERIKTHQAQIIANADQTGTVIERRGKFYLNPNGYLETEEGWVRVSDITRKIGGVSCPVHGDSNGSEFAAWNHKSSNVFLRCKHCGTIWADKHTEPEGTLVLPWIKKTRPPVKVSTEKAQPFTFDDTAIIEQNDRYLDPHIMDRLEQTGVMLVKSPKGTGKTTMLKPFIQRSRREGKTVTLIGHRVNLLRELADRLDLDYYLELPEGAVSPFMAICMDSLTRFEPNRYSPPHTVIIDESEQVFSHLVSDTLKGKRTQVMNKLIWALRGAQRVVLLDADLTSEMTLELMLLIRGQNKMASEPFLGVINRYVFEGRKTLMYESMHHLLAEAVQSAQAGRKVFISTNYRESGADVFYKIFEALGLKVLLVSSHSTASDPAAIAFMTDTSAESQKYDVIICTPTVQTGVSIDNEHFDEVYGMFWHNVGTFQDIDQAMSRVRRVDTHKVWIQEVEHKAEPLSEQEIYERVMDTEAQGKYVLYGEGAKESRFQKEEYDWAGVYARIKYLEQEWKRFKPQQFVELRQAAGYELEGVPEDIELMALGKDLYKAASEIPRPGHAAELWGTPEIDAETFDELSRKTRRSHDEYLQVERYRYHQLLKRKDRWDLDNLTKAVDQDLLRLTSKLEKLLHWTFENRLDYDKASRDANSITFTDSTHLVLQAGLYDLLCDAIGLPLPELVQLAKDAAEGRTQELMISREQLLALATVFEENQREFARYLKSRITDPMNEKNLKKVWNSTLGAILPLKSKKVQIDGARAQQYFVDWESRNLILELFDLR